MERLFGGFHVGGVIVEGEDHFVGERVGVYKYVVDDGYVFRFERGVVCGHRGGDVCQVVGYHVGVVFDDDGAVLLGNLVFGDVDAVQQLALLVDRCFRCVEVLCFDVVVVEQLLCVEFDDVVGDVVDGL